MSSLRKFAFGAIAVTAALTVAPTAAFAGPAEDEAAFVTDINSLRSSKGIAPLVVNHSLGEMARNWAHQMANAGRISHNPNMAGQAPAGWLKVGENVGVGGSQPALHEAFVKSPGHYANLVDPSFDSVGVAVVESGGRKFVVENFMKSSNPPKAAPAAAPAPRAAARHRKALPANDKLTTSARSFKVRAALAG